MKQRTKHNVPCDCKIVEHITSGYMYDGDLVYKIRMKIDGKFYLSDKEYALDEATKFYNKWED